MKFLHFLKKNIDIIWLILMSMWIFSMLWHYINIRYNFDVNLSKFVFLFLTKLCILFYIILFLTFSKKQ